MFAFPSISSKYIPNPLSNSFNWSYCHTTTSIFKNPSTSVRMHNLKLSLPAHQNSAIKSREENKQYNYKPIFRPIQSRPSFIQTHSTPPDVTSSIKILLSAQTSPPDNPYRCVMHAHQQHCGKKGFNINREKVPHHTQWNYSKKQKKETAIHTTMKQRNAT